MRFRAWRVALVMFVAVTAAALAPSHSGHDVHVDSGRPAAFEPTGHLAANLVGRVGSKTRVELDAAGRHDVRWLLGAWAVLVAAIGLAAGSRRTAAQVARALDLVAVLARRPGRAPPSLSFANSH